jgi:hypothetical protein
VACPAVPYISTLSHKWCKFWENFNFLYNFCLKHLSFQEKFSKILLNIGLHVKYPLVLSDFGRWAAAGRSPAEIVGSNPTGAWIFVCCECRVLSGRGLCDELITHLEESYRLCCVVVCDLETWRIGAPYIYDIRSLMVNDLTLILLTWRKWWANNASKQQMGFNSGFKGLNLLVRREIARI